MTLRPKQILKGYPALYVRCPGWSYHFSFELRYFCLGQILNRTASQQVGTETLPHKLGHAPTPPPIYVVNVIGRNHTISLPVGLCLRIWTINRPAFVKCSPASNLQELFLTNAWFPACTPVCVSDSIIIRKQQNTHSSVWIPSSDGMLLWYSTKTERGQSVREGRALHRFWNTDRTLASCPGSLPQICYLSICMRFSVGTRNKHDSEKWNYKYFNACEEWGSSVVKGDNW